MGKYTDGGTKVNDKHHSPWVRLHKYKTKGGVQKSFSFIASASKALWWWWWVVSGHLFLAAHFYWAETDGYLNRIGTVKCSHNWPVKGSRPGNPGEDAFTLKKKWFFTSPLLFHLLAAFSTLFGCVSGFWCILSLPVLFFILFFCLCFTAVASLQPSRCRAAGVALGAKRSRSSALRS